VSPLLLASAAFLAVALPTLAAVLSLTRGRGVAAGRLASVEQLPRQYLVGAMPAGATTAAAATPGTLVQDRAEVANGRRDVVAGHLFRLPFSRRLLVRAERDLEFTSWTLSPTAYLLRRVLATLFTAAVAWLALRQPLAVVIAAIAVHLVTGRIVAHQVTGYRRRIGRQTEEVIEILIAHLRAGQSLVQSIGAVSDEAPTPSRDEYGRVARRVALGAPVSEALRALERRTPVTSVALLISALNMHHRIGGDLPMLLRIAADSVRDQVRLQDELRTAAAGQMLAAYIVVALPVVLFAALYLIDRPYISGLLQPGWNLLLVLGAVMEVVGFLIMRSFTRIQL
jgi:tight adherence protein B